MKTKLLQLLFLFTIFSNAQIVNIPNAAFKSRLLSANSTNSIAKDVNGNYIDIDANNDNEIQESEELISALEKFVQNYNNNRYHEALKNLTPSDVYYGRADKILEQRAIIKQQTIAKRRQLYFQEKIINL